MITLYQIDGGLVPPIADARLYEFLSGGAIGIVEGAEVTSLGGTQLSIADGWGVVLGRVFSIESETIAVTTPASGTVGGRLIVQIDIANEETPISLITQAETPLPDLVQEDINASGTVYQLPLATFSVDAVQVTGLTSVTPIATAAFMPVSGGTFTGDVVAASKADNGLAIRNVVVVAAGTDLSTLNVPAGTIILERK